MTRVHPSAGIAIGPILFIIALLGILAFVASSTNTGGLNVAGIADRVAADVGSQANLIRSKIGECELQYHTNGVDNSAAPCLHDPYPCSDPASGTLVTDLTCPGDPLNGASEQPNIWTGPRNALLPPPTKGFNPWHYMNAGDAGGRCIWISPTGGSSSTGIVAGLTQAASKFSSQEVGYDSGSGSQKFVIFITVPTGTADLHCTVP